MQLSRTTFFGSSSYERRQDAWLPFHNLNQQVQQLALGFSEDVPQSPEALRRFVTP